MILWICRECGQEVMAVERPTLRWSDGHVCKFHVAPEKENENEL